jgi:HD-GYP domain-containing protein (c-di-GMP phosphodiesterase class II)
MNNTVENASNLKISFLKKEQKNMQIMFEQTATALANAIDAKDVYTHGHSMRVAEYSHKIAVLADKDAKFCNDIFFAGLLHDVGKIGISNDIIQKNGKLTPEEFEIVKEHTTYGNQLLSKSDGNIINIARIVAYQHHEHWDGSGYPQGLSGSDISIYAQIASVADVYDAMTASSAYRDPKCAFQVISDFEDDGLQKYDPKVIMTFIKRMADAYQNARVILSDGSRCKVIYLNPQRMSKPMVEFDDGKILDLSTSSGISITSII